MMNIDKINLIKIITRLENIETEKLALNEAVKDCLKEAEEVFKLDAKIIKQVLRVRKKKNADDVAFEQTLLNQYLEILES